MGFSRYKPKQSANLATQKGVRRDSVEEAQQNTRDAHQASDRKGIKSNRGTDSEYRQDQMQAYKAAIRSEAVHARRLAEQIDNLAQNAPIQTRKQAVMTDSTTIDSGKKQEKQRRATDKPRAANVRSSFNPLHPSMELPPEQLIRLLGLESKKIRKHRQKRPAPKRQATATPAPSTTLPKELERSETATATNRTPTARSTHRQREYEQAREKGKSINRCGLWLPALAVGLVCGAAASAYLFWMQPQDGASDTTVAQTPNKVPGSTVTVAPGGKPVTKAPAIIRKSTPASAIKNDPAWRATVEARGKHLRDEAKQRFEERLKQVTQTPIIAAVPVTAPQPDVTKTDPQAAQTPPITTAPDSAPLPEATGTHAPGVITTGEPVVEQDIASHDETLVESADNTMSNPVTEPEDKAIQAPEAPGIEDNNAGESNEAPIHSVTAETTDQPGDKSAASTPAPRTPPQEGAAELF